MDKIRENLGIVVREAREKTGLTQSELSETNKHQLLLEIQSCNDREAAELLRVTRYMLELLRKRNSDSEQ